MCEHALTDDTISQVITIGEASYAFEAVHKELKALVKNKV
jgi:hypothetical protein